MQVSAAGRCGLGCGLEGVVSVCVCACTELSDEEQESPPPVGPQEVGGAMKLMKGRGLSFLALSVRVEDGIISMLPEVGVAPYFGGLM